VNTFGGIKMRRLVMFGLGLMAARALAGCQKKTETAATHETAPPKVAAAPAAPIGPPKRKPGLWAQTISSQGVHQISKICLDAATDAKMTAWGQAIGQGACSKNVVTPIPGGWRFEAVCPLGAGGTSTTTGEAIGDFNSKYVIKAKTVTTGSSMPQANGEHAMEMTATWNGPCPAGVRPGDIQMSMPGIPKGMTININDMMAMK
jgi:hypothetical protein